MSRTRHDVEKVFPNVVAIADPGDMSKHELSEWENLNRDTEWREGETYAPEHNWAADPGGSWSATSSKTYFFESAFDADIFQKRFA